MALADISSGPDTPAPPERNPPPLHRRFEQNAGWIVIGSLVLLSTLLAITRARSHPVLIAVPVTMLIVGTILLFTRPLQSRTETDVLFRFGYGFLATVVVALSVLIYWIAQGYEIPRPKPASTQTEALPADGWPEERLTRAIAIVRGCDYELRRSFDPDTEPSGTPDPTLRASQPGMPARLHCGDLPPQWVISIGGSILRCHFDGTCPAAARPPGNFQQLERDVAIAKQALERALSDETRARRASLFYELQGGAGAGRPQSTGSPSIASLREAVAKGEGSLAELKIWQEHGHNIEGSPIIGGIVVPVYFVVLAVLGALVSMMRKLPEFQHRVSDKYDEYVEARVAAGEQPMPPINAPYARELIVFQILQVLSAPVIAVVAYSWARPDDIATTSLLAFAAGFSSEVFLLAIRGVVDRLIGQGPRPVRERPVVPNPERNVVPARGAASPAALTSSGGFKIGDSVTLMKPVGPFLAGARGTVLSIEPGGELIVQTTHDHQGVAVRFRLQAQPPESFRGSHAADKSADRNAEEPAG